SLVYEVRQRGARHAVQLETRLPAERRPVDALRAPQLDRHRFAGALGRLQLLALERGRLSRQRQSDVAPQVACVQLAPPPDVAGGAHAEAEVRLVRPVHLVVPAAATFPRSRPAAREIRDLVMLEAGLLQGVNGDAVQLQLGLLVQRPDLPALALLPQ